MLGLDATGLAPPSEQEPLVPVTKQVDSMILGTPNDACFGFTSDSGDGTTPNTKGHLSVDLEDTDCSKRPRPNHNSSRQWVGMPAHVNA